MYGSEFFNIYQGHLHEKLLFFNAMNILMAIIISAHQVFTIFFLSDFQLFRPEYH
jgi:hypothetical protein